jgi:hypothetical protein
MRLHAKTQMPKSERRQAHNINRLDMILKDLLKGEVYVEEFITVNETVINLLNSAVIMRAVAFHALENMKFIRFLLTKKRHEFNN